MATISQPPDDASKKPGASKGWRIHVEREVMDNPKLSCGARVLYAILRGYQGKKCKQPFPAIKTLQAKIGVRDAIYDYLKELHAANLITRIKERTSGKFCRNKYAFLEGSPATENRGVATEENGAKPGAKSDTPPPTENPYVVGENGENADNSANPGAAQSDTPISPPTGFPHTAQPYTENPYTKDSHLKGVPSLKDSHGTAGTDFVQGTNLPKSKAPHLQANEAGGVNGSKGPKAKLHHIRRPANIPSERVFQDWLAAKLPDLYKRRPDLYGKLYAQKWHLWHGKDWEVIRDWRKLCRGLAKKTEKAAASTFADPFVMEYQGEIIDAYNDFAARHEHLGFLPVNQLSPEVEKVIDLIADEDLDGFLEILEQEAEDPKGCRTLVRCFWNNY